MKKLITNYSFDKDTGIVTLNDFSTIDHENILLITNVTDGLIIYNFADPSSGATVSGNTIDLEYDTSDMDNGDALQIYIDTADEPSNAFNQLNETELTEALLDALESLTFLSTLRDSANQLRVGIVSGTVGLTAGQTLATLTTLTTLTNMVNMGGYSAQPQIPAETNMVAVQSNVNNIVVS